MTAELEKMMLPLLNLHQDTLPDKSILPMISRVRSYSRVGDEVQRNWNSFCENEVSATPRKIMVEKVLTITLGEILRKDPEFGFTIIRAGSSRERLGTILLNPQKLHVEGKFTETFIRPKLSSDMDVMLVPYAFRVGDNSSQELVSFEPSANWTLGHVYLHMPKELLVNEEVPKSIRQMCVVLGDMCYISPILAKDVLVEALLEASKVFRPPILMTALRVHGPAVEYKVFETSPYRRYKMEFLADLTFAFHIPTWPECAQEWKNKNRLWPSNDVIEHICKMGCHVVPIGQENNSSNERLEWRLSFSQAEAILSDNVPQNARKVYLAVKSIFKEYFKMIHCDGIASYHMKVCFLRFVEQTSPALWTDENVGEATCRLLDFVYDAIYRRQCPHLFISRINLFSAMNVNEGYFNLLTAFDKIRQNTLTYVEKITTLASSKTNGCFSSTTQGDHVGAYDPDQRNENSRPIQKVINKIVDAKFGSVPFTRDYQPINVGIKKSVIPFLTGNSIVTKKSDNTGFLNGDTEALDNDQTGAMMAELLTLARKEEEKRRRMRSLKELNCFHMCDYVPSVKAMQDSEFIFHVDADVEMTGSGSCKAKIKSIFRFRSYMLLFLLAVITVSVVLASSVNHAVNRTYQSGLSNTSLVNCTVGSCDLSRMKTPYDDISSILSRQNANTQQNNNGDGGRYIANPRSRGESKNDKPLAKDESVPRDIGDVDRPEFYKFKGMKAPELHSDDRITNTDSLKDEDTNKIADELVQLSDKPGNDERFKKLLDLYINKKLANGEKHGKLGHDFNNNELNNHDINNNPFHGIGDSDGSSLAHDMSAASQVYHPPEPVIANTVEEAPSAVEGGEEAAEIGESLARIFIK